jgi:hypothetical protein
LGSDDITVMAPPWTSMLKLTSGIDAAHTGKKGHRPKPTPLGNLARRKVSYIFFSSQILVVAFQVPWAATQSASFFAFDTSPANAGPVTASAMAIANVEMSIFMGFSPLR